MFEYKGKTQTTENHNKRPNRKLKKDIKDISIKMDKLFWT